MRPICDEGDSKAWDDRWNAAAPALDVRSRNDFSQRGS